VLVWQLNGFISLRIIILAAMDKPEILKTGKKLFNLVNNYQKFDCIPAFKLSASCLLLFFFKQFYF
jgi:hypothetical protein